MSSNNKIINWFRRLREDWNRIITVSRKPDRNYFSLNLKVTLLVLAVIGVLAYIIQLVLTLIGV
ncbi:protein translocase SEC61 complex subunit gamma [Sulfolobus sp. E1]|uniref:protein translocase SEC61 complex subunit gamma n=1 Tax=Saccharolobus sp. A20 TaxID=1891280 RepID=UPI000845C30B|nr:protein translocase SEC61 complex subunit gamma [Sulfolobus sp. A20]TRM74624.1 protein translocase SEC61 complex subunit gamma [Sulfolobus sp. E5]TRM75341.1 protein translocase SEC61 complex subunit gamma [Sulfolobus sp. A20-N-F8]TRM76262.1 protein translocase SEC61 complex subunit gamma [Sulfolobus sp. B5]TRM80541.1 protein translocase SEC61 complex subunit gamma [Sulfolobus sp. F3]TRM81221.1 protein translocase SEC61 complex subunit gamma [Sulfolobus sp. D5]TRM90994.1 protein translocase